MTRKEALNTLGLKKDPSFDELKSTYRRLVLENHPDRGGDSERFKAIEEAYRWLLENPPQSNREKFLKGVEKIAHPDFQPTFDLFFDKDTTKEIQNSLNILLKIAKEKK